MQGASRDDTMLPVRLLAIDCKGIWSCNAYMIRRVSRLLVPTTTSMHLACRSGLCEFQAWRLAVQAQDEAAHGPRTGARCVAANAIDEVDGAAEEQHPDKELVHGLAKPVQVPGLGHVVDRLVHAGDRLPCSRQHIASGKLS